VTGTVVEQSAINSIATLSVLLLRGRKQFGQVVTSRQFLFRCHLERNYIQDAAY